MAEWVVFAHLVIRPTLTKDCFKINYCLNALWILASFCK
jgi:hypothetical protein